MKRRLRAPSPALVISLIALFIALGGTSFAAITAALPKNSVGTKQLKKNAVTGVKIKNHAVTAAKINTSGLTVPSATHATSADSATSATNATNATNATHAASSAALDSLTFVRETVSIASGATDWTWAKCPSGLFAISGGVYDTSTQAVVTASDPWSATNGPSGGGTPDWWFGASHNNSASAETETVWAICAKLGSVSGF